MVFLKPRRKTKFTARAEVIFNLATELLGAVSEKSLLGNFLSLKSKLESQGMWNLTG